MVAWEFKKPKQKQKKPNKKKNHPAENIQMVAWEAPKKPKNKRKNKKKQKKQIENRKFFISELQNPFVFNLVFLVFFFVLQLVFWFLILWLSGVH